jgi:hypothetical protein
MILNKLYKLYLHALTGAMIAVPFLFVHYIEQQFVLLFLNIVLIAAFHIMVVRGYIWINDPGCGAWEQQRRSLIMAGPVMAMIFAVATTNPGASGMLLGAGLIMGSQHRSMILACYALATLLITFLIILFSSNYLVPSSMLVILPMFMLLGFVDRGHLYTLIHPATDPASIRPLACKILD